MKYEIDQSGKIEQTNKLTIVAFGNGRAKVLKISSIEKQKLIKALKEVDHPRHTFIYKIFSSLVFLLLKDERIVQVTIDNEYLGNEATIKNILVQLFRKASKKEPEIQFGYIGKTSLAHKAAIAAFRGELKPDIVVKAVEILGILYKKQKKVGDPALRRDNP